MSDHPTPPPHSPEEISAVLGSIRELVAEETRLQQAAAAEPAPLPEPLVLGADMLLDDSRQGETPEEEALRTLIRDILREELQGEVGEKFSRNIRKMIRREIGQALLARGMG